MIISGDRSSKVSVAKCNKLSVASALQSSREKELTPFRLPQLSNVNYRVDDSYLQTNDAPYYMQIREPFQLSQQSRCKYDYNSSCAGWLHHELPAAYSQDILNKGNVNNAVMRLGARGPTFSQAMVAPLYATPKMIFFRNETIYRNFLKKKILSQSQDTDNLIADPAPTPTLYNRSRTEISFKKDHSSLHNDFHSNFCMHKDNTQFSNFKSSKISTAKTPISSNRKNHNREFIIHCAAPDNWLRMKWGNIYTDKILPVVII